MAFKHALVVDDSKSARVALKRMLEKHHLIVDFAASGEEAIEFLKAQPVDVIFMDHSMPGMDGLEAVSAIKADPRTAMIPVMMYTAKEGEVYVGQARALGAIGVLPKQVHPAELFDVLLKLGLVEERRAARRRPAPVSEHGSEAAAEEPAAARDAGEADGSGEVRGIALEGLVTRILQDQHHELRADILASHRDFAREVAQEILEEQRKAQWLEHYETDRPRTISLGAAVALALALLLPMLALLVLYWQARGERDVALAENLRLTAAAEEQLLDVATQNTELLADFDLERQAASRRYADFLEALQWGVNQGRGRPVDGVAFDDAELDRLRELLIRLEAVGFEGTVRLSSHLGEFCLVTDGEGVYALPEPELPLSECSRFGHPLDGSASVSQRQSLAFANFLATSPLVNGGPIDVEVVALSRADSARRYPFPAHIGTAGEWNEIAALNNRVEYEFLPAPR
jgi:CheY-like chemotaxis protein